MQTTRFQYRLISPDLNQGRKEVRFLRCTGFAALFCAFRGIIKRCTPLSSKCTPHILFVKRYREGKRKRLHGDHFRITAEPVIVKCCAKTLVNRGFCKKKLDTRFDTHCIKTSVQLWCERGDSNPHGVTTRTSNVLVYHSNTLAVARVL